jgi:hypothetical protein
MDIVICKMFPNTFYVFFSIGRVAGNASQGGRKDIGQLSAQKGGQVDIQKQSTMVRVDGCEERFNAAGSNEGKDSFRYEYRVQPLATANVG